MKSAWGSGGTRRRALLLPAVLVGLFTLATASSAWAQTTIFVVRHAERAEQVEGGAMMMTDPDLSAAGQARAESLAAMLKDAGIKTIFVTQYKRTQQTAAPLARALGVTPEQVGSRDVDALAQKLREASCSSLVVGHSNSVPNLLKALGTGTSVEIAKTEYDNLFIVTLGGDKATVARLRYR
jgi:phosphohistidine phosphatase SixA